ncbi:MAG: solute carrier family 23 protein [Thermodesulfobacteriota bacterium]|jgi:uracil permease
MPIHKDLIYGLDQFPPWPQSLMYAVQWVAIFMPILMILSAISSEYLGLRQADKLLFFQRLLLTTGGIMILQTLWGHRYPLLDGPSSALLLNILILAPGGMPAIQGGMIAGGIFLLLLGVFRLTRYVEPLFTDNVISVTVILIAITLLPFLAPLIIGQRQDLAWGDPVIFGVSVSTMLFIVLLSQWLPGFLKTISLLLGILAGSSLMGALGRLEAATMREASWLRFPHPLFPDLPSFSAFAVIPFLVAYVAVVINGVGSIYTIGEIVGKERMGGRVARGIGFTGLGGLLAGALGTIGTVSFGLSPGVVLVTRVGSRFPLTLCGVFLCILAFFQKALALFMSIPSSVVGAALITAMASQVGAGISVLARSGKPLEGRDYLVIGLPILVGGIISILPGNFFQAFPFSAQAFLKNGLVVGIVLVLLLEHLLLRRRCQKIRKEKTRED